MFVRILDPLVFVQSKPQTQTAAQLSDFLFYPQVKINFACS